MRQIPIVTLWIEGAVFHGVDCNGEAAVLVFNSDIEGLDEEELTTILYDAPKVAGPQVFQVALLMDDFHTSIGADESLSFDEIRARARAQVDDWQNMT